MTLSGSAITVDNDDAVGRHGTVPLTVDPGEKLFP
jgi:hypothetical protein